MRFAANLFYNAQVTTSPTAEYYHLGYRERQERYHASTLRFLNTAGLPAKQRQEQLTLTGQPGIENWRKIAVATLRILSALSIVGNHSDHALSAAGEIAAQIVAYRPS